MKPNLFIIGAMKSGTSSLYEYLGSHPEIFMSPVKEPMHFSREELWSKGNLEYIELFKEVKNEKFIGEGSTEYSKLPYRPGVAERIHKFNPDSRIIYIMRNPFDRIVSQYKHMVKKEGEKNKLSDVILTGDYMSNSHYSYQIQPYINLFENVFIGTFEAMVSDPQKFCNDLFYWLGVEKYQIANIKKVYHASPKKIETIDKFTFLGKLHSIAENFPYRKILPYNIRKSIKKFAPKKIDFDFESKWFHEDIRFSRNICVDTLKMWTEELKEMTYKSYDEWDLN